MDTADHHTHDSELLLASLEMSSDLSKLTHGWNTVEDNEIASLDNSLHKIGHF